MEGALTTKIANIKKKNFVFPIYKRTRYKNGCYYQKTYENDGIEVITDKIGELWLNEKYIQKQFRLKKLPALTNKYDEKYKKCRSINRNESTEMSQQINHIEDLFMLP